MGLYATAKGLTQETCFDCGYITYGHFILNLIETAYGKECSEIFRKHMVDGEGFTQEECDIWNTVCNDDLDILIQHSDCDGKFTPEECRRIYNAMKDLKMDMIGHNYGVMKPYNMLDHWKNIFRHCAKRRVNLYFR